MKISERFTTIIDVLGMNNNSFALSLGKSPSNIKPIIDGKIKPGWDMLELIFYKYPHINPTWLMKGEGQIFTDQNNEQIFESIKRQNDFLIKQNEMIIRSNDSLVKHNDSLIKDNERLWKIIESQGLISKSTSS